MYEQPWHARSVLQHWIYMWWIGFLSLVLQSGAGHRPLKCDVDADYMVTHTKQILQWHRANGHHHQMLNIAGNDQVSIAPHRLNMATQDRL